MIPKESVETEQITIEELFHPKPVIIKEEIEKIETPTENENVEFSAEGYYFIIGNKPKSFENVYEFEITLTDYFRGTPENNYNEDIPPQGYLSAKKKYNFTRINIANKKITFETETKNGISYEFIGEFIDEEEVTYTTSDGYELTHRAILEGYLIKKLNGKKIAESKFKFAAGGC